MAARFRVWQFCTAREWNVTIKDISEGLGDVSIDRVRGILQGQKWTDRVRSMTPHSHAQGSRVMRAVAEDTRNLISKTVGHDLYHGAT